MYETTQQPQTLQVDSEQNFIKSRRCRPFTIVEDAIDNHELGKGEERTYRKFKRLIRVQGGRCDWPIRRIAAHLKIGISTCKSHLRALRKAGLIQVEHRKNPRPCRYLNDTNIYSLPSDGGAKIEPQVLNLKRNTNTTTPREVPRVKSYAQLRWEWNQARRKHHPRPHVGRCQMRYVEALRISSHAAVGTWDDETNRLLREQEDRYAEWDRELREHGGAL